MVDRGEIIDDIKISREVSKEDAFGVDVVGLVDAGGTEAVVVAVAVAVEVATAAAVVVVVVVVSVVLLEQLLLLLVLLRIST